MRYGLAFPHWTIGNDASAIRDYGQAVEGAGFDYMLIYDHVAAVHVDRFGADGPAFDFTSETATHEIFVLMGFLAAATARLELTTSVLLLAQRQTMVAAKQAAEVDILSGGRLRLAIGVGWNAVEYESLKADFHTRGRRLEEQIATLKRIWTQPLVSFEGRWDTLDRVGINPLPPHPLDLWIGGGTGDVTLRRAARHANGWMVLAMPPQDVAGAIERLRGYLGEAGRDPASFGIDVRLQIDQGGPDDWVEAAQRWQALGVTHLALGGAPEEGKTPIQVLEALGEARKTIDAAIGG